MCWLSVMEVAGGTGMVVTRKDGVGYLCAYMRMIAVRTCVLKSDVRRRKHFTQLTIN